MIFDLARICTCIMQAAPGLIDVGHLQRDGDTGSSGAFDGGAALVGDAEMGETRKAKLDKPIRSKGDLKVKPVTIKFDGLLPATAVENGIGGKRG